MSKIYCIRHAQASYLADNYDQLSPKGIEQSKLLGQFLVNKGIQFDRVFVGPLVRQKHTYELVANAYEKKGMEMPKPTFLNELKEHEGTEGVTIYMPRLMQENPTVNALMLAIQDNPELRRRNTLLSFQIFMDEWTAGNITVDGIESWKSFREDVSKGLKQILSETQRKENVAVFTSGGTIASITGTALAMENNQRVGALNFSIRNTSISQFLYSKNRFDLLSLNEVHHLSDDMISYV